MIHRKYIIILAVAALVAAVIMVEGCASTRLVNVWRNPHFTRPPLTKVFVVAMKKDAGVRRAWEDRFVWELEKYGVKATPSYDLFPDAPPDTTAVKNAVQDNHFDGLLLTINLPTRSWQTYYPPDYAGGWGWDDWDDWYGSYGFYYGLAYSPGFFETTTEVRNRTEVWSTMGRGALEWTATSEVFNPNSSADVAKDVADKIVPALARQGLIYSKK